MGVEVEYKFAAEPQLLEQLAQAFGPMQTIRMETTYYDTPGRTLARQGCTLRLRRENDRCICTLKTPLPDGSRGEWECQADSIEAGLQQLPQARVLVDGPLEPVCGARFLRRCCRVGSAELALDQGLLLGGGSNCPLCEVELEHKSGQRQETLALANHFAARYGLQPEPRSKFARAMALAEGGRHG